MFWGKVILSEFLSWAFLKQWTFLDQLLSPASTSRKEKKQWPATWDHTSQLLFILEWYDSLSHIPLSSISQLKIKLDFFHNPRFTNLRLCKLSQFSFSIIQWNNDQMCQTIEINVFSVCGKIWDDNWGHFHEAPQILANNYPTGCK